MVLSVNQVIHRGCTIFTSTCLRFPVRFALTEKGIALADTLLENPSSQSTDVHLAQSDQVHLATCMWAGHQQLFASMYMIEG